MDIKDKVLVANVFAKRPGGRDKLEGENNGEEFLIKLIYPKLLMAIYKKHIIEIDFTGMYGYPSSFISGSFGNLSYWLGKELGNKEAIELILRHIKFVSNDNEIRVTETIREITNPTSIK